MARYRAVPLSILRSQVPLYLCQPRRSYCLQHGSTTCDRSLVAILREMRFVRMRIGLLGSRGAVCAAGHWFHLHHQIPIGRPIRSSCRGADSVVAALAGGVWFLPARACDTTLTGSTLTRTVTSGFEFPASWSASLLLALPNVDLFTAHLCKSTALGHMVSGSAPAETAWRTSSVSSTPRRT